MVVQKTTRTRAKKRKKRKQLKVLKTGTKKISGCSTYDESEGEEEEDAETVEVL